MNLTWVVGGSVERWSENIAEAERGNQVGFQYVVALPKDLVHSYTMTLG